MPLVNRSFQILIAALALFGCFYAFYKLYPITIDDAYITFAYSKHAARGEGFVFSLGERIEATSSFLWALILVPFELLGIGSVLGAKILGILLVLGVLYLVQRIYRRSDIANACGTLGTTAGLIAATIICFSTPFLAWSFQGMENALVAFLIVWAIAAFRDEFKNGSSGSSFIPLILLEAARPEGFMFWGTFAGLRFLGMYTHGKSWFGSWFIKLLLGLAAYEAFGFWYYGALLPNTVGAKVGGLTAARLQEGLTYLYQPAIWQACEIALYGLPYLVLGALVCFIRPELRKRFGGEVFSLLLPLAAFSVLQAAFAVTTGGDWMPGGRFISHAVPVFTLFLITSWLLCIAVVRVSLSKQRWASVLITLSIAPFLYHYANYAREVFDRDFAMLKWINDNSERAIPPIIAYMNEHGTEQDIASCSDIGRVGYYYKGRVFDWWGLASPEVVKRNEQLGRINAKTVLEVNPKFVILYSATPELTPTQGLGGFGGMSTSFMQSDEFLNNYKSVLSTFFTDARHHVLFERKQ